MSETVIKVENLGKKYRLGQDHSNLLSERLGNALRNVTRCLSGNNLSTLPPHVLQERDFWALKDVSFEVKRGEVVGIIGRNGAGKSTLLKILSRITAPTVGKVEMFGRVASLLEVGTGFHPELTGRENIFLNGAILGMSKVEIQRRFDEIVAFAEVEKFLDTPVKRYSSGMYVRLAFAVAAHLEPEILVVDEVLAVGDMEFQKKCLGKMESVARFGRTVLFVSHNMASIKKLCSKVMYLKEGRLVAEGATNNIVGEYLGEYFSSISGTVLPDTMHRVHSPLQIRRIEFINSLGQEVAAFEYGEEILLRLILEITETVRNVRVGIGLVAEGLRITTVHTPAIKAIMPSKAFPVICRISQDVLLPNYYTVQLGAHDAETGRGLDWVPDAAIFQVLDVATRSMNEIDEKETGFFRLDPHWEWGEEIDSGKDAVR